MKLLSKVYKTKSISCEIEVIDLFWDDKKYTSFNKNSKHDHFVITQVPITIQFVLCMLTCPQKSVYVHVHTWTLMHGQNHFTLFQLLDILVQISCSFFLAMCNYLKIMSTQNLLSFLEKFIQDYLVSYKG